MKCLFPIVLLLLAASPWYSQAFEIRDGDRVVLLGNTFIERAQSYGHLEACLTASLPDKNLTFRNLGWSGDTVFGHARSYFGPPKEGFERLTKHLAEVKPTVIISCYGAVAAFEGRAGLQPFLEGYGKLLDMMEKTGARIVIMSPPPLENHPAPLPNQDAQNGWLAFYRGHLQNLARERGHAFADVFQALGEGKREGPLLTENGVHFTDQGYAAIAPLVVSALGIEPVAPGKIDSALRQVIVAKNQLFFYRWRPQNETYLFGFRKHEQGNNAVEVPQFDPLIAKREQQIQELVLNLKKD